MCLFYSVDWCDTIVLEVWSPAQFADYFPSLTYLINPVMNWYDESSVLKHGNIL